MKAKNSDASTLADYLRAAAKQRRLLRPRLKDKNLKNEGTPVYYAVDTDIIVLFSNPVKMSVSERKREGYAEVFHDDKDNISIAVGRAQSEFIFQQLTTQRPLLVLPPLEQELKEVFEAVAQAASQEQNKARVDIESLRKQLLLINDNFDPDETIEALQPGGIAEDLVPLLRGTKGPSNELRRIGGLLTNRYIATPDALLNNPEWSSKELENALAPPENLLDQLTLSALRRDWFNRIYENKNSRSTVNIERDAQALALLEWANLRLEGNGKIALITGDAAIYNAAQQYEMDGGDSFADSYLRHPRSFLAEPYVLSPESETIYTDETIQTEFVDWLDTFLAKLHSNKNSHLENSYSKELETLEKLPQEELERQASMLLEKHPNMTSDFRSRWEAYTNVITLKHGKPDQGLIDLYPDLLNNAVVIFDTIQDRLDEVIQTTWESCFDVATTAGYGLVFNSNKGNRTRNIPPLYFDSFSEAREFVRKVLQFHESGGWNNDTYKEELRKLKGGDDHSDYSRRLAFALLFAAEGVWRVAAILSERLVEYAESEKGKLRNVSGREAAYLCAVSLRHSTKRIGDLQRARVMLDRAIHCLEKDKESRPTLEVFDIRFDAESLALSLTHELFSRLTNRQEIQSNYSSMPLKEIQEKSKFLLNKIYKERQEKSTPSNEYILLKIERHLLTNLFTSLTIQHFLDSDKIKIDEISDFVDRFKNNIQEGQGKIQRSYLVDVMYNFSHWWIKCNLKTKTKEHSELIKIISYYKDHCVMPYDKARFLEIRKIILQ